MRSRDVNVYSALNRNRTKRCQIDPEQRAADPETGQGVWERGGVSLPPLPQVSHRAFWVGNINTPDEPSDERIIYYASNRHSHDSPTPSTCPASGQTFTHPRHAPPLPVEGRPDQHLTSL